MAVNLFRFTRDYIMGVVVLFLAGYLLLRFAGISLPTGLSTVLPSMLAAQLEGQRYTRQTQTKMPGQAAWISALAMTALVVVFNGVIVALLLRAPEIRTALGQVPIGIGIGLICAVFTVILLIHRLFLGLGGTAELKQIARRDNTR